MIAKQLQLIFHHFSRQELLAFRRHLVRLRPREQIMSDLFNHLLKYHGQPGSDEKLSDESVFQTIYGTGLSSKKDRKKLANLYSFLYQEIKEYFLWEEVKKDSFEKDVLWLRVLEKHKAYEAYDHFLQSRRNTADNHPARNEWDFLKRVYFHHLSFYNSRIRKFNPRLDSLDKCITSLEQFNTALSLKFGCENVTRKKLVQSSPPAKDTDPSTVPGGETYIRLYRLLKELIEKEEWQTFVKTKSAYMQYASFLNREDQIILFTYLINFIASEYRKGKITYLREAFDLYLFGDKNGILAGSDVIDPTFFHNIVSIACKVKELDWAEQFITRYHHFLDESIRRSATLIDQAAIAFERGQYRKVVDLIGQEEYTEIGDVMRVRSLLLCAYLELNDERFFDYAETYRAYLRRNNKITGQLLEALIKLITLAEKLSRRNIPRHQLTAEIKSTPHLYLREWFLQKAEKYKPL